MIGGGRKEIPTLFSKKEECAGCSACFSICPVGAIAMEPDEEDFLYPIIHPEVCIGCKQCIMVCAFGK